MRHELLSAKALPILFDESCYKWFLFKIGWHKLSLGQKYSSLLRVRLTQKTVSKSLFWTNI